MSTYAMLLPEGQWAVVSTVSTHGGTMERISGTSDVNQATVMGMGAWRKWKGRGITVPATAHRTVTIQTGGVQP